MLARLQAGEGDRHVEGVRSDNADGINVRIFQKILHTAIGLRDLLIVRTTAREAVEVFRPFFLGSRFVAIGTEREGFLYENGSNL